MIWNDKYECMDREELEKIQLERLQQTVERVYNAVPYYRKLMEEKGVEPGDIKTLKDLRLLPFIAKQDLRENYPFGLFTVPMSEVVRIHSSSGTTGKPTVVGYTRKDIDSWAELLARTLTCANTSKEDVVQVAYGYGLFTGGLGVHYGAERIGASVIPISGGNTQRQVMLMQDFGTTVLACTPSYALFMGEVIQEMGVKDSIKLKSGVFGAEPWSENMRREIEDKLGVMAIDIYGLSEVIGPGFPANARFRRGCTFLKTTLSLKLLIR